MTSFFNLMSFRFISDYCMIFGRSWISCIINVQINAGSFSEAAMFVVLGPCKTGHYCNRNSSKELPCKAGTYSNISGLFNISGCRTCPLNSYCPLACSVPIRCPVSHFFPAELTKIKVFEGKRSKEECRRCPVDPCDHEGKCVDSVSQPFRVHFLDFECI